MHPEQDQFMEQLHRGYFGKLMMYAFAATKNRDYAQDVVQDTFHEALRRIDTLMAHPNPGGWLMTTLKYKLREHERMRQQLILHFLSLNTDLDYEPGESDPNLERVQNMDEPPILEKIQSILTKEEYYLLKRLTMDRASHLEVAKELGISIYASQKRLERIRRKLRPHFPGR